MYCKISQNCVFPNLDSILKFIAPGSESTSYHLSFYMIKNPFYLLSSSIFSFLIFGLSQGGTKRYLWIGEVLPSTKSKIILSVSNTSNFLVYFLSSMLIKIKKMFCKCKRCNNTVHTVNLRYFHFCKLYTSWWENTCDTQIVS